MTQELPKDDNASKMGMWLFLFTELLLFGGLFLLYSAYFTHYRQGFAVAGKEMHLVFATINTVVLLTSSLLVAMAVTAVQRDRRRTTLWLLAGTILCAGIFLFNKYLEWSAEIARGLYPNSPKLAAALPGESVFYGLYYLTLGLHGLHVLVGATLLSVVALRVRRGIIHGGNYMWMENSALYWHLVDLIWIFIFPLYYLIY